ncbi:MAG: 3-phosphoglycerate dehydrogenase family protein [Anaeroplasma sp.]
MKAYCLNKISKVALATLKNPDKTVDDIKDADSILVRSQAMHDMDLDSNILAVARAGAGVNNIPLDKYAEAGVVVFNTPGANANAVKELVICGLLLASRDIIGGNEWVKANSTDENIGKTAEKAKAQFAGNEIIGKTISVVGLGVIGVLVANACVALGMKVIGYDPYLSIPNAMKLDKKVKYVEKLEEAVANADFVTIHVPLMESTKYMFNKKVFNNMDDGTILVNFARDTLVNDDDLLEAIQVGKIKKYVTDFANAKVAKMPNTICLPHLGASTEEAEDNCALMAIDELKDYIENGNIRNSVNYPSVNAGVKTSGVRICINHKNVPGMIANFTTSISQNGGNIINMVNKSKNDFAYTVIDVETAISIDTLRQIEGVLRVRVI